MDSADALILRVSVLLEGTMHGSIKCTLASDPKKRTSQVTGKCLQFFKKDKLVYA